MAKHLVMAVVKIEALVKLIYETLRFRLEMIIYILLQNQK